MSDRNRVAWFHIIGGNPLWNPDESNKVKSWYKDQSDGMYWITMSKHYPERSKDQNAWMWGLVEKPILDHINRDRIVKETAEELHDKLLYLFAPREIVELGNYQIERIKRTSEMNTAEMTQYLEDVRAFAAVEFGLGIPDPDPSKKRR